MFCEHCKAKGEVRKQVVITCKVCGKEEYVPLFNNNKCQTCNEKANTCQECGKILEEVKQKQV